MTRSVLQRFANLPDTGADFESARSQSRFGDSSMNQLCFVRFNVLALALMGVLLPHALGGRDDLTAKTKQPRYRLVDLVTFGGTASYFQNGFDGILNDRGTAVGYSSTDQPDPFNPFCAAPNCFATHAFRSRDGRLFDLGTLPGG